MTSGSERFSAHQQTGHDGPPFNNGSARGCGIFPVVIAVLLLRLASPDVAHAGVNAWTSNGPDGGLVHALAVDPTTSSTLYAGTTAGVFKSTNAGVGWRASGGLSDTTVIAIDPLVVSTLYAGTSGGLFKSTDSGANWKTLNQSASTLAIDPLTPSTLYAATLDGGLVKSTDGGASWNASNAGLPSVYSPPISALAIDPQTPSTLYAGKRHGNSQAPGVFRSTDGGANWHVTGLSSFDINALAIDLLTPSILYAGEYGADGLVKSTDGGASWSSANNGLPESPSALALAVDPHTPSTLFAIVAAPYGQNGGAVFQSADGGQHWTATGAGLGTPNVLALAIDPLTPTTLYAGTAGDGVFKSTDDGASWVASSTGLMLNFVVDSTVDAPDAMPGDGVCASVDGACTLRAAIDEANAFPGGSTIAFNLTLPATITLTTNTELALSGAVTIRGPTAGTLAIDGNHATRVFDITSGAASITKLTIQNGFAGEGGGISVGSGASVRLTDCALSGNRGGFSSEGGGLYNAGTATLTGCTLSGNLADYPGGGIANSGTVTLTNCTLSGNAGGYGGGGGVYNDGTATLTNCTLSGNAAEFGGGILATIGGTATLTNTIVANNSPENCNGDIQSAGHNLSSDNTCFAGGNDWLNTDPRLAPLANYGGPTATLALCTAVRIPDPSCTGPSPAIDAGAGAVTGPPLTLTTDQRGLPRQLGLHVDIGAVESGATSCIGDCGYDGKVTVDELVRMANIALDTASLSECEAGDSNRDSRITVDELVTAVNNALNSCPSP